MFNKCEARVTTDASATHQSINQSIKQKAPSHSINQSIHNLLLILMDSTNPAINQSINRVWGLCITIRTTEEYFMEILSYVLIILN